MKWMVYKTDKDRKEQINGTEREGQYVSDAPGPGNRWMITPDGEFHLVTIRSGRAWEMNGGGDEDSPLPDSALDTADHLAVAPGA